MQINDSERLTYQLMGLNSADLMYELDQDPQVLKYINHGICPTLDEIKNTFLPRLAKYYNPDKGWGLWGVYLKETGEYIGWVLVRPMDFFGDQPKWHDIELGWRFKQFTWGKGYGTEAAQQVMAALSKQPDIHYFTAIAMEENTASINIMKKLGMKYVKTDIHKDADFDDEEVVYYTVANK